MSAMPCFVYGDKTYQYSVQLLASRKKSILIHVLPNASIEVKAPLHTNKQTIVETMKKKARWVVKHVEHIQSSNAQVLPREYVSGETHFYQGRRYMLTIISSDMNQVKLSRGRFMIQTTDTKKEKVKELLEHWYKAHAKKTFEKRVLIIASRLAWLDKIPPTTVRHMRKQWGSCSSSGRISLNWNLVKAPLDCIDYVITHELCHLREHNHSKKFYALQDRYNPNWKPMKAKLDEMAECLLVR